jgi:hypothetical protein
MGIFRGPGDALADGCTFFMNDGFSSVNFDEVGNLHKQG